MLDLPPEDRLAASLGVSRTTLRLALANATLSFISLPTVPELRLTDNGLIDVRKHALIDRLLEYESIEHRSS